MTNKKKKTVCKIQDTEIIANAIYDKENNKTFFLCKKDENIKKEKSIGLRGKEYFPISADSGLIQKNIIKLPSGIEDYIDKKSLIKEIKNFIHDYMDISEEFETVSAYYVLLSWVYEDFNNLPYMRVRAKPGNGKSRYLNVMGDIVFNPMIFKGDQSESVLFRIIDRIKGTLILDEADFRFSDRTNGLVKMLNNGFEKGGTVSRNKTSGTGDFEPQFFEIYGPKIIANINLFKDDALESRCITEVLEKINVRIEASKNLDSEYYKRAELIRNKLLKFRFDNSGKIKVLSSNEVDFKISARGKQISASLLSLMPEEDKKHLETLMILNGDTIESIRDNDIDTDVIKILAKAYFNKREKVELKEMVQELEKDNDGFNKMTPKKIGSILQNLNIRKKRAGASGNTTVSIIENKSRIEYLVNYHSLKEKDLQENYEWG